jgi:hypothetical protein
MVVVEEDTMASAVALLFVESLGHLLAPNRFVSFAKRLTIPWSATGTVSTGTTPMKRSHQTTLKI